MRISLMILAVAAALSGCSSPDLSLLNVPVDGSVVTPDAGPVEEDANDNNDLGPGFDIVESDTPTPIDVPAADVPVDVPTVRCGDGVCSAPRETCTNCPADCHACDPCTTATTATCATCTPVNNCGWCSNNNICITGMSTGPTNGSCTAAQWAWLSSQCPGATPPPDPCLTHTTCAVCTAQATCGWCASTHQCLTGNETASSNGACTGTNWRPMLNNCT